jgi:periplasmic protein TonB
VSGIATSPRGFVGSGRWDVSRWFLAGIVALAAHLGGGALALMHWPENPTSDAAAGALVVELAPMPAVAPVNTPDLAHGPQVQEAMPTQEASRQLAEPEEIALSAEPSPAPDPEVSTAPERPEPKEQPKDESAREAEREKQDDPATAVLATAPPRVDAAPSPAPPSPGRSAMLARAQATWQKALIEHLNKHKRYPEAARSRRAQGTVVVAFKLDHGGRVVTSQVTRSSGSRPLDEEALAVLQRANPLPAPPHHLSGPALELVLPIQFRIK